MYRLRERAGWRVIAEDLAPAQGGLANTSVWDYRAQSIGWASADDPPDAVVGASLGGWLALHAADAWRARGLVLVNPVPPADCGVLWQPQTPIPDIVPWSSSGLEETALALPDGDPEVVRWASKRWRDESGLVLRELASGARAPRPLCATLVLISELDQDVPPNLSATVARWCGGESELIAGASHLGPLLGQTASACASLALDWLQRRLLGYEHRDRDHE
ncbi:MAG: alpha/beta hydrolase [Fimbriimonadales bacterium]